MEQLMENTSTSLFQLFVKDMNITLDKNMKGVML